VETEPELAAHHYTEANLPGQAVPYWHQAGQVAQGRSAHHEAIAHLNQGLRVLTTLPETRERDQQELPLRIDLGKSLMATKGWGAPEVLQAYSAAKILCERLGDPGELFTVLRGEGQYRMISGNLRAADELARQCMQLAEMRRTPHLSLRPIMCSGAPASIWGLCHRRVSRE
jgi:predicted ATPase